MTQQISHLTQVVAMSQKNIAALTEQLSDSRQMIEDMRQRKPTVETNLQTCVNNKFFCDPLLTHLRFDGFKVFPFRHKKALSIAPGFPQSAEVPLLL